MKVGCSFLLILRRRVVSQPEPTAASELRERFDAQRIGLAAFERLEIFLETHGSAQHSISVTSPDNAATLNPWWDVRAAWIVLWRVRSNVVVDFQSYARPRWWQGWPGTLLVWWRVGHGRHLVS